MHIHWLNNYIFHPKKKYNSDISILILITIYWSLKLVDNFLTASRWMFRMLLIVCYWLYVIVCSLFRFLRLNSICVKWQRRRCGNRYTTDDEGSVIYRPTISSTISKYVNSGDVISEYNMAIVNALRVVLLL